MDRFCTQLTLVLAVTLVLLQQSALRAEEVNRAALVVRLGDQSVLTRCVTFSAEQITGEELLERSGLDVVLTRDPGMGAFVCKIDRDGCPAENCLCAYPPDYWHYWLRLNDAWQSSPVGASNRRLRHGDVDGWTWGGSSVAPPPLTFADVCPADAPLYQVYLPLIQHVPAATAQHFSLATLSQEPPSPQKRSGLMVQYGDGSIETVCVTWEGGLALTAAELLARSGLEVQIGEHDYGGSAVCKIGKDGCALDAGENCYCAYDPNSDTSRLWLAYQLRDGVWHDPWPPYVNRRNVYDGDVEAWVWGYPGSLDRRDATRPAQVLSFEQICAMSTPTPTLEPSATPTMTGTPTTTPSASVTSTPIAMPPDDTPTATMTATATTSVEPTMEVRAAHISVIYLPLIVSMPVIDVTDDQPPMSEEAPPTTNDDLPPSSSSDPVANERIAEEPVAAPRSATPTPAMTPLPPTIPAISTPTITPLPPTIPATSTPTITPSLPTMLPTLPPTVPPTSEPPSPTVSLQIVIEATSLPVEPERPPTLEPLILPTAIVRPTSTSSTLSTTPTARGQLVAAADVPPTDGSASAVLSAEFNRPPLATTLPSASRYMAMLALSVLFVVLFVSLIVVLYLKQRHPRLRAEQAINAEGEEYLR